MKIELTHAEYLEQRPTVVRAVEVFFFSVIKTKLNLNKEFLKNNKNLKKCTMIILHMLRRIKGAFFQPKKVQS